MASRPAPRIGAQESFLSTGRVGIGRKGLGAWKQLRGRAFVGQELPGDSVGSGAWAGPLVAAPLLLTLPAAVPVCPLLLVHKGRAWAGREMSV